MLRATGPWLLLLTLFKLKLTFLKERKWTQRTILSYVGLCKEAAVQRVFSLLSVETQVYQTRYLGAVAADKPTKEHQRVKQVD